MLGFLFLFLYFEESFVATELFDSIGDEEMFVFVTYVCVIDDGDNFGSDFLPERLALYNDLRWDLELFFGYSGSYSIELDFGTDEKVIKIGDTRVANKDTRGKRD